MDDCTSTSSPVSLSAREGDDGGGVGKGEKSEREWAREKRMKELLLATRGLLLHFPGSCRFNNSVSRATTTGTDIPLITIKLYVVKMAQFLCCHSQIIMRS